MKYYNLDVDKTLEELKSKKEGLSDDEINKRLKEDGLNKLVTAKKESTLKKFLKQFNDLMIIVLIISSIFSFTISLVNNESFTDSIIIIAIVILNAILGFIQERKADRALDALKKMQTTKVKVKRNGKIHLVDSEYLVKGDILVLEAGDKVPADARIIYESALRVDESALTGESNPVEKDIEKVDENVSLDARFNMIYSGTSVVYGKCEAVICETGMNTEFGKIAESLNETQVEMTPLQKKINDISKFLSMIIAIIILIMMLIGIIKKIELLELIMLSISLAVAAIPEGLPAVITIILSLGMNDLAKKKAIVRKMASVETLGSTQIICSDKTGTITQNKMTVVEVYSDGKIIDKDGSVNNKLLLDGMILNNDSVKNGDSYIGDPTEIALLEYCDDNFNIEEYRREKRRVYEIPFDSERKMMSTVNKCDDKFNIYTKGSFDSVIECCSSIYIDGTVKELTLDIKNKIKIIEKNESLKAYRLLAFAYKQLPSNYKINKNLESDLIFIGMVAMIDPPRDDVKEAILECKKAGIKPIMITGDSLSTAKAIAKNIGVLEDDSEAIMGIDLDKMTLGTLKDNVDKYSVYARVSPMNKLNIVKAWKEKGMVVAMTGDGVNDAPALKYADIGVGMGITGTEVSKNVSDIVLTDDSFSTIVTAVREGRRIFDNIRNVLVYLLTGNIAEVIIVFLGMLLGVEIFIPIQLLYINLITDSIPAICLAFEKESDDIMEREVRKKDSSFFTPFMISKIITSSIIKTITILLIYSINSDMYGVDTATTLSFFTLVVTEILFAFSCRNLKKNIITNGLLKNKYLNIGVLLLLVIQIIVFTTPIKSLFNIVNLETIQVIYASLVIIFMFILDELLKNILSHYFKD